MEKRVPRHHSPQYCYFNHSGYGCHSMSRSGHIAAIEEEAMGWEGFRGGESEKRQAFKTHAYLREDYVLTERLLRRRFAVSMNLFWKLHDDLVEYKNGSWKRVR